MSRRPPALVLAASLFTVVPMPAHELDRAAAARAIAAFPWLGLLLGAGAGAVAQGLAATGAGGALAGAAAVAALALVTGGMHLDGLADAADGLGSRKPPAEAVAIMKRSDIGPMGVAAVALVLLLGAAALASPRLAAAGPLALPAAVAAGAMTGRLLALAATTPWFPTAHAGGFAGLFGAITRPGHLAASAAASALVTCGAGFAAGGVRGLAVFAAATASAWALGAFWSRRLVRRLGGMNGDAWGSLIELGQLAFWLVVAAAL